MNIPPSHIDPASTPPLSVTEAVALFDHLANMDHLAFDWPKDGCYARTHLMCREMQALGHVPSKAWAFEADDAPLQFVGGNDVRYNWWYHVAAALPVCMPDGGVTVCVFDPSIYDGPVPVAQWASGIRARPEKTCVAAFGEGAFGSVYDYRPMDGREDFYAPGEMTGAQTDERAQEAVLKNNAIVRQYGVPPRIVYSAELRQAAEQDLGHALPREGLRWVSVPLHHAREKDNDELVERLTRGVRPAPPPSSFGKG